VDSFTLNKIEFDAVRRILAGFASCSLGKSLALRVSPSRNPEVVRRRLELTSQMVRTIRDVGVPPFGGVTDITGPLGRAKPAGGASGEDFIIIASALEGAANVRRFVNSLGEDLEKLHELADDIGAFDGEVKAIHSVIEADGRVRDEASNRLRATRREIAATTQHIHDVIYGYLHQPEVARLLQDVTVTLHGDRYVLPVKAENRSRLPGVVHRASNTGATVFVEPNASVELNNRLVDLYDDERAEVQRLLNQLALRVQGRAGEIASTMRALGRIDLLSAKAQYAYQFDMTCPEVSERGRLELCEARHPLLISQAWRREKAGASGETRHDVVPIDVRLGQDFDLLVITGPNTGGKTVALKTVALLVVMTQCGMHIPTRRGAAVPVFRDVFIDVGDEQSLQQSLSTFGAHIKRIRYILAKADKASLVLLDELGAGTDPDEGGAIGQAILDELRRIGCQAMATTHLSVLKAYAFNNDRVDNASVEFDTRTLSPKYHLRIGTPGESHAITVAQKLGLPKRITAAARRHLTGQGKQFRRAILATTRVRQTAEAARRQAQSAQIAAETQQEVYQAKLGDLHRLQEEFETWLATLSEMQPGQEVPVPALNKTGKLVRLELHRQVAVVDCDNAQVEVPLRQLVPDLGQESVRRQIANLRQEILDQARLAEQARSEARRMQQEYHRSLSAQKQRARRFDTWLGAIARLKVGDEVPISRKPGKGKVVEVDLPGLRATIATDKGRMQLPLQELFPQTGPFAAKQPRHPRAEKPQDRGRPQPMRRRSSTSSAARADRQAILDIPPGGKVFVVPFNKQATLIRLKVEKDLAVVQSGIFEMEIPLADLQPLRERH